jgi:hypothetical protein
MKKITTTLLAGVAGMLLLASASAFARDEQTIIGEGKCGKCALHETEKCQNVIQVTKDGKTVNYYLTQNKVSKDFHHDNLCTKSEKVKATGTVKEVDGKMELTATTIEIAK